MKIPPYIKDKINYFIFSLHKFLEFLLLILFCRKCWYSQNQVSLLRYASEVNTDRRTHKRSY